MGVGGWLDYWKIELTLLPTNERIVACTAGTPAEPSSHKVRNQNRLILHIVVAKLNQYTKKFLFKIFSVYKPV